jgi:DNA polymerase III alpha subunit
MEVWRQVESFSGYSFCKAHSASFAVESFQSLYLKTYYPLEFMTAVVNNFGGFYNTELYLHEARMCGAYVHPPCVNHSTYLTNISEKNIYVGFIHIAQLEQKIALAIVEERLQKGDYRSLKDFVNRVPTAGREQIELLIRIGAFRFTKMNKYELMWEKNAVYAPNSKIMHHATLFEIESESYALPAMQEALHEQAFDEIELLGFPLCSPFDLINTDFKADIYAKDLKRYYNKTVTMIGYYVTRKDVTTVNGKLMNFGTWIDAYGHFFDTTHFPPSLARYPFKGRGMYALKGKIVDDFDFPSMEVDWMEKLPFVKDGRYS